jgi:dehydrogenase/reductase SDR family member 12
MYNTKFPEWEDATSTGTKKYDGQFAYSYAKRGQVLLCERWAALHPKVPCLSTEQQQIFAYLALTKCNFSCR